MHSLRTRLLGVWALSLTACLVVTALLFQLNRQSTRAQTGRAEAVVASACDLIRDRYAFYITGWTGRVTARPDAALRADLTAVVELALAHQSGVEGGLWQSGAGPLAYAYPTYEGTGRKTDLPAAERDRIRAINQQALGDEQSVGNQASSGAQTLLLHACPLPGPLAGLTAWTMTRVRAMQGLQPLQLGAGVLLAMMLLISASLGGTLLVWGRHVRRIQGALGGPGALDLPKLDRTGERELDQIVDALNAAGLRVAEARQEAHRLAARAERAERLAGLGRIAAGVAHEIRNPLAAARLQGENALAGDDARRRTAIGEMLGQVDRLEALVGELLAMTQRAAPRLACTEVAGLLTAAAGRHKETAAAKSLIMAVRAAGGTARLDPAMLGRVLDNLLTNAIRHAPPGSAVVLAAERRPGLLVITVADAGAGVPPEMADRLFEPFVTGRPEGTGLGLAIARELTDAHGGRLVLRSPDAASDGAVFPVTASGGAIFADTAASGAIFAIELPQEDTWPAS